ncbi:hypothetical protein LEMLEM_LOCUS964 [Lemmus lemmus]
MAAYLAAASWSGGWAHPFRQQSGDIPRRWDYSHFKGEEGEVQKKEQDSHWSTAQVCLLFLNPAASDRTIIYLAESHYSIRSLGWPRTPDGALAVP